MNLFFFLKKKKGLHSIIICSKWSRIKRRNSIKYFPTFKQSDVKSDNHSLLLRLVLFFVKLYYNLQKVFFLRKNDNTWLYVD